MADIYSAMLFDVLLIKAPLNIKDQTLWCVDLMLWDTCLKGFGGGVNQPKFGVGACFHCRKFPSTANHRNLYGPNRVPPPGQGLKIGPKKNSQVGLEVYDWLNLQQNVMQNPAEEEH